MIKISAKRIKDRNIRWEEHYTERTQPLKDRYHESIGVGSYYRWEGHDYTTDSDYYVIVSPAKTKELKKRFFAGIKKLPPIYKRDTAKVYSPYGEYFTTIKSALSFVSDRYGVRFPKGQLSYTIEHLEGIKIPRHVKG
ncbi:MAG: hypothetical protein H8E55_71215 [Pelagibacterales bacterium]|nr:hypothetical protein [Pelagibacterales bacterium]